MEEEINEISILTDAYHEHPEDIVAALNLAQQYCNKGWFNEAIDIYQETMERDPDNSTVVLEYGNTAFRKGDMKKAVELFTRMVSLRPGRIEGWNNLGIAYIHLDEHEEARAAFERVLEIEPENSGALLNMGNYHFSRDEYEKARSFFERACDARPDFPDAWFNLGNTLIELGLLNDARMAFEKALRYQREFPSALKNLGWVYEQGERLSEAQQCYTEAIKINKADSHLHVNLGNVYLRQKNYDEAKKCFLKAVRLSPNELTGWMGLRGYALAKGDVGTFIRATLAVLSRLSDEMLVQSIDILYELNQIEKADELLAQADRLGRNSDLLDMQRLLLYQRQGHEPEKAAKIAERLSKLPEYTDTMHRGLARYFLNIKDFAAAIGHIEKIEKKDCIAQGILWRAMLAQKQTRIVRKDIIQFINDNPESHDPYFLLAAIEADKGNMKRAEVLLVYALDHGFNNMEEIYSNSRLNELFESMAGKQLLEDA